MAGVYTSFLQVEVNVKNGVFRNESEFKHAFIEALKAELNRSTCSKYLLDLWLVPAIDETLEKGKPDIRLSNLVIEVEPPLSGLGKGREQLMNYMRELYRKVEGKTPVYGVVTDGNEAELWIIDNYNHKLLLRGSMTTVLSNAVNLFCAQKIPVIDVEDLVKLFGV